MKLNLSLLLLIIFAPTANAFLWGLINFLFGPFIEFFASSACNFASEALSLTGISTCGCDGNIDNDGITASFTCVNDDPVCFASDETLCGRTEFSTLWTLSNAIATSFNTCVDLTQPPYPASVTVGADIPSPLCVLIEPVENQEGDLEYSSCVASMGGTNCAQCDICESGLGVKFDCSNINIQPNAPAKVDGPVADVICLDVSLGPEDEGSKDD